MERFAPSLMGVAVPSFFCRLLIVALVVKSAFGPAPLRADSQQPIAAPVVTKIEPPNWWIGVTPEVLLLLSGHGLEATHVGCNLSSLRVTRTEATAHGEYLFVWLKIGPETRSGTAVCRIQTALGPVSFELPLAARSDSKGKFQGLAPGDIPSSASDLSQIRSQLRESGNQGVSALHLSRLEMRASGERSEGAVDFYSIDPSVGSLQDLQELVASAHAQNKKVILDLNLLSVGAHHPWVAKPPRGEWLVMTGVLDAENPIAARYLLQNSIWWIETSGIDGVHVIQGARATKSFWRGWTAGLRKIYPNLTVMSE